MNVWILTGIRSGSTLLYNLMRDTGLFSFPEPHSDHPSLKPQRDVGEFCAPNHNIDPWDVMGIVKTKEMSVQYLKMKARLAGPGHNLLKVPMEQFQYYLLDYKDRPLIESLFPDSRYIWLEREDMIARAVSAYIFFTTKTPHVWTEKMNQEYRNKKVPFDANGILDVYFNHLKPCDWSPFLEGTTYLKVTYEELVGNPAVVLRRCIDWLGLDGLHRIDHLNITARQPKFRTERPETEEFKRRLKSLMIGML